MNIDLSCKSTWGVNSNEKNKYIIETRLRLTIESKTSRFWMSQNMHVYMTQSYAIW